MNKAIQLVVALIILVFTVGMAGLMYVYLPYVLWTSGNTGLAIVYILWNVFGPMLLTRMKSTLEGYNK
ncbi:putative membrane protein [Enterococcus phage vB_EfaS_LM99]|nr:putative membrane protein [Enterococcus phage vB_EfaS_LM99]